MRRCARGQRPVHHGRPVAGRLPVGARPPGGAHPEPRPAGRRRARCSPTTGPRPRRAGRAGRASTPAPTCTRTARCSTARRSTPGFTNIALEARAAGLRPRAVRLHRRQRRPAHGRRRRSPAAHLRGGAARLPGRARLPLRAADAVDRPPRRASGYPRAEAGRTTSSGPIRSFPGRGRPPAHLGPPDLRGRAQRDGVPHRRAARLARRSGTTTATGEPWFVHASYLRPHPPYRVVAPYHDLLRPGRRAPRRCGPPTARGRGRAAPLAALAVGVVGAPADEAEMRQIRATYYGMMAEVDDHLGRLLDWLDDSGQADDTLVVLTVRPRRPDRRPLAHGEARLLGRELPRAADRARPARAGDGAPGARVDAFTEHVDVMPTILEWLGARRPVPVRRPLARARSWSATAPPRTTGAPRCTGSGTSATRPATSPRTCSGSPWSSARSNVIRGRPLEVRPLRRDGRRCCSTSTGRPGPVRRPGRRPAPRRRSWPTTPRSCCRGGMRHADRTLTGTVLTPLGPFSRVDPRVG